MKRLLITLVGVFCLLLVQVASTAGQTSPSAVSTALSTEGLKIKGKVEKLGLGHEVTVKMNDGREFHGSIKVIDPDGFTLAEVDLRQLLDLKYNDTKKVSAGYGEKGFMGRRVNPKRSFWIGLAVIGGLLAVVFGVATNID
jgi:hypothetical protein